MKSFLFALALFSALLLTPMTAYAEDYIHWMDFNVPLQLMQKAYSLDVASQGKEYPLNWVELLAYASAKNWGNLTNVAKAEKDINTLVEKINSGEKLNNLTEGMNLYGFYREAYQAVLGGFVGEYETETGQGMEKKYGLKVFSPIAKNYSFSHYDDFGDSRSYGYRRRHLGNDLMGSIGTPVIAVEDGYIEAMGWNQFGGWRIGIRTHDKKRYYYYAHLRKDRPFVEGLKEGDIVKAGDVIGYLGMTGYSANENTNNIKVPHLHFGLQIIFDESQKDGVNQIWVDLYNIVEFLNKNKMSVRRNSETGEFERAYATESIAVD